MADAGKTGREDMLAEKPEEFLPWERGVLPGIVLSVILPGKGDVLVTYLLDAVIGDGCTVGIAAQVTNDLLWSTERLFSIDHPVFIEKIIRHPACYPCLFLKFPGPFHEPGPEYFTEMLHFKEVFAPFAGMFPFPVWHECPAGTIRCKWGW